MPSNCDTLFRMLADPKRRLILDLLAERGPLTVGQLAAKFPDLVASGISKHLMTLRAAGLVSATRRGQQQIYQLEADTLAAGLTRWIVKYEQYWSAALELLHAAMKENAQALAAADPGFLRATGADVSPIVKVLNSYQPAGFNVADGIFEACRRHAPDVTPEEVADLVADQAGSAFRRLQAGLINDVLEVVIDWSGNVTAADLKMLRAARSRRMCT